MVLDRKRRAQTPPHTGRSKGHGREPASRGRHEDRAARATNGDPPSPELRRGTRGERDVPFYQTNPPFCVRKQAFMLLNCNWLHSWRATFFGGFVLENEPTGGGYFDGFGGRKGKKRSQFRGVLGVF